MSMEFLTKHTIFVVVSISSLITDAVPQSKVEGYYNYEHSAQAEAERLRTWKTVAVVPYEVTINDLVRVLNAGVSQ